MNYKLNSPDGKFDITCILDKTSIYYCVNSDGNLIICRSNIGFILKDELLNNNTFKDGFIFKSEERKEHRGSWKPLYGEKSEYKDNYNELIISFENTKNIYLNLTLIFRVYNEGVAFRCKIEDKRQKDIYIEKEAIEFILPDDYYCYDTYRAQGEYSKTRISNIKPGCERPFDLQKIIDYANKKGIGIILYVNQRALTKQLEQILPIYKKWRVR